MENLDLLILGTGPAATRIASHCGEVGWRVGIVDPRPFGGTCALRGCNPKKVLVRAAELYDWIERARGTGVQIETLSIDWSELIRFKNTFTDSVTQRKESTFREAGIVQYHGSPRFLAADRVAINDQEIVSRKFVVATGAAPARLGIPGEELMTLSDEFLDLATLPRAVLFVGGGYVTFEFAHVAARAGAEVLIVESGERPLAKFEAELVDCLLDRARQLGIQLRTATKARSITRNGDGRLLVTLASQDGDSQVEADLVVHGAGRVPNTNGLDLEAANIRFDARGIHVNQFLQSVSNPNVYAAGDVASTDAPPLSPVASYEGRLVARNLVEGNQHQTEYGAVATVVFSVPAIASVGLSEKEAADRSLDYIVRRGDRAGDNSMKKVGAGHARYKILVERDTQRILGAHLLGPDAAETINIFALAMKHGISAPELKSTLFSFPTFIHDTRGML